MTSAARQRATKPDLLPTIHLFRVMHGEAIIGQFSNIKLADRATHEHRGAVVLDVSVQPHKVVYSDGKWLDA